MYLSYIYFLVCLNIFNIKGEDTTKANCGSDTSVTGVVQYVCPPRPYSTKTSIHVYSELLIIDCNNTEVLDDTVLPRGNYNNIFKLVLEKCPLPAKGFKNLMNRFNITSLIELEKLTIRNSKIRTLETGVLDDFKNLKELDLSFNGIERIEEDAFKNLTNLINLTLDMNQLKNVTRKMFENCRKIERINLDNNPNVILHDAVFSRFEKLKEINLSNNSLKNISENLFNGSTNLLIIYLSNNSLATLEKNVFTKLENLEELHLNGNEIKSLHSGVFASLKNLKKLYLQYNQIEVLDGDLLKNMKNLVELNLSHNQINFASRSDSMSAFQYPNVEQLKIVDLSHNKILLYPQVLSDKRHMEKLDLSNNFIEKVKLMSMLARKYPNSGNLVTDLDSNKITSIEIEDITDLKQKRNSNTIITITNNPILCDCSALNLAIFLQGNHNLNSYVRFEPKDVQCSGKLDGKILNKIELIDLTCHLQRNCSSNRDCDCLRRSFDDSLIVNCSSRGLTEIPDLIPDELSAFDNIIVHLDGNRLKNSPGEHNGFGNVTELYLEKNEISNITWIPPSLKVLNLSENAMSSLNGYSLELLNRSMVEKLSLGKNPWKCDCEISEFVEYLRTYETVDSSQIRCETTGEEIIKLNKNDLCASNKKLILILSISVLVLFVLVSCATALYFKFKKNILIWLYNYGLCLYLVDEDKIDEDKTYDAFISYSHHDEDFVLNNIVSNLETGPNPYKLCVHVRDFIPGEYIKTQITNSIRTSKRTIVFLSPSFLESVWGKLEFKTAHTEAMLEGRARVIIVVYGDVDLKMVDDDLKSHINANTYVKWDDPWFWKKLKYALPKRRRRTSKNGAQPQRVADPSIVSVPNTLEEESLTSLMRN